MRPAPTLAYKAILAFAVLGSIQVHGYSSPVSGTAPAVSLRYRPSDRAVQTPRTAQTATPAGDIAAATRIASSVLARLDAAWNAADGKGFAAQFSADADVINIFGTHFRGRADIATRMQLIFDTIFKGSTHRSRELEMARMLGNGQILAMSSAVVDVPTGPQAPRMVNRQTFLLVDDGGTWRIRHWHNTLVRVTNDAK